MKTALLVVDLQNAYYAMEESKKSLKGILGYVNYSILKFREADQPIIFIQDEEAGVGTHAFDLYEKLDADKTDIFISKRYSNAFWQTELENILKDLNVGMVLICGFAAEYGVQATYQGAMERGFEPALLQHGIASTNEKYVDFVQDIYRTTSIKVVEYMFNTQRL
ncbi:cysteine hydrolase family protein [Neobacillus terrae]|uniref:cysteine hydrolase family protein n=1 Tax=Neobacillus terrae TaxID=3034837 RepID=UPI00140AF1CC|nr:isochorismatase family protein [Neobacillus terrae]NHM31584.1 isochorismatase family protein [Neobacillus terrae]